MKADGWLVEEAITTGRFRRGRGLRVDWSRTPWPTGADAGSGRSTDNDEGCLQPGKHGGQWSMPRSMIDQLPKQGGGQLPPFKGGIDRPPPAPTTNNRPCSRPRIRATTAAPKPPSPTEHCTTKLSGAVTSEVTQPPAPRGLPCPAPTTSAPPNVVTPPPNICDGLYIPSFLKR